MQPRVHRWVTRALIAATAAASIALLPLPGDAADSVAGTFTVKGKTTTFSQVYATLERDPESPSREYLILLLSDRPIAPTDRRPERLLALAKSGTIRALRLRWLVGSDDLAAVPYHAGVDTIGLATSGQGVIDLRAFDEKNVDVVTRTRMIGQDWHYNARIKAAIAKGGVVELEAEAANVEQNDDPRTTPVEAGARPADVETDARSMKLSLGKMGYDYNPESFTRAIKDGKVEAVELFLRAGMSANVTDAAGNHSMVLAAMFCAYPPPASRTAIVLALVKAKGDVRAADENKSTALLWAAQSCDPTAVQALIAAGADVNARAAGGGTPLMMATALGRTDVAEMLRRAGAR